MLVLSVMSQSEILLCLVGNLGGAGKDLECDYTFSDIHVTTVNVVSSH